MLTKELLQKPYGDGDLTVILYDQQSVQFVSTAAVLIDCKLFM